MVIRRADHLASLGPPRLGRFSTIRIEGWGTTKRGFLAERRKLTGGGEIGTPLGDPEKKRSEYLKPYKEW